MKPDGINAALGDLKIYIDQVAEGFPKTRARKSLGASKALPKRILVNINRFLKSVGDTYALDEENLDSLDLRRLQAVLMAIPITDNVVRLPGKVLGALGRLVAWLGESPIKKLGNRVLAHWLNVQNSLDPDAKESQDEDWLVQLLRCMTSSQNTWQERYDACVLANLLIHRCNPLKQKAVSLPKSTIDLERLGCVICDATEFVLQYQFMLFVKRLMPTPDSSRFAERSEMFFNQNSFSLPIVQCLRESLLPEIDAIFSALMKLNAERQALGQPNVSKVFVCKAVTIDTEHYQRRMEGTVIRVLTGQMTVTIMIPSDNDVAAYFSFAYDKLSENNVRGSDLFLKLKVMEDEGNAYFDDEPYNVEQVSLKFNSPEDAKACCSKFQSTSSVTLLSSHKVSTLRHRISSTGNRTEIDQKSRIDKLAEMAASSSQSDQELPQNTSISDPTGFLTELSRCRPHVLDDFCSEPSKPISSIENVSEIEPADEQIKLSQKFGKAPRNNTLVTSLFDEFTSPHQDPTSSTVPHVLHDLPLRPRSHDQRGNVGANSVTDTRPTSNFEQTLATRKTIVVSVSRQKSKLGSIYRSDANVSDAEVTDYDTPELATEPLHGKKVEKKQSRQTAVRQNTRKRKSRKSAPARLQLPMKRQNGEDDPENHPASAPSRQFLAKSRRLTAQIARPDQSIDGQRQSVRAVRGDADARSWPDVDIFMGTESSQDREFGSRKAAPWQRSEDISAFDSGELPTSVRCESTITPKGACQMVRTELVDDICLKSPRIVTWNPSGMVVAKKNITSRGQKVTEYSDDTVAKLTRFLEEPGPTLEKSSGSMYVNTNGAGNLEVTHKPLAAWSRSREGEDSIAAKNDSVDRPLQANLGHFLGGNVQYPADAAFLPTHNSDVMSKALFEFPPNDFYETLRYKGLLPNEESRIVGAEASDISDEERNGSSGNDSKLYAQEKIKWEDSLLDYQKQAYTLMNEISKALIRDLQSKEVKLGLHASEYGANGRQIVETYHQFQVGTVDIMWDRLRCSLKESTVLGVSRGA